MKPEISTPSGDWDNCPLCRWPQEQCKCGTAATPKRDQGSDFSASGDVAQSPSEGLTKRALDEASAMLDRCASWIDTIPHDDNCYVTKEPPGNKCVCGKDSLLQAIVDSTAAYASYEPLSEGDGDPHWKPMFSAAAPLTRGLVGGLDSTPPEAAGSDEGKFYALSDGAITDAAPDLAPGLNATNDELVGQCRYMALFESPNSSTLNEAADRLEQLQRELREARNGNAELSALLAARDDDVEEGRATIERQRKVLAELVACKDLKAAIRAGPVGSAYDAWCKSSDDYEHRQPLAWVAARRELQEGGA